MNQKPLTVNQISEIETISATEIIKYLKLSRQMPDVLTGLINQKIIKQTATKENITLEEQELQTAADRFRFENDLISSKATLRWLEKYNLSVAEFEEWVKDNLLAQKLAAHLFQDRVEAYFYAHQLNYHQAIIYEIVLTDFNLAMELFYSIQEQELSFWSLANQYIQDDELRRRHGYQGMKTRDRLQPEVAAAVFSLNSNDLPQVLKPIAVNQHTHLIYVEEIIQPVLDQSLRYKIINQLFEDWLNQQRKQLAKPRLI